jgi:hypothetical protein
MKKINFNQPFVGLDGKPVVDEKNQPLMMGKFLANIIARSEAKDKAMEKYELCHKLYIAEGEVEIKDSEKEYIKAACEGQGMTIMVAAQILKLINA